MSSLKLAQDLLPGMAAWTGGYVLCRHLLFPRRSADFGNRVVSTVHALLAIALSVPALDWAQPLASVGQANTGAQTRCMTVSLAYFVYDFFVCLLIDPEPVGTVHHLCTMAGLAVGLLDGKARGSGSRRALPSRLA